MKCSCVIVHIFERICEITGIKWLITKCFHCDEELHKEEKK